MAWSSLLAPLLCCLPMLIFFQFFGDPFVGAAFISFALLPIMAAFAASKRRLHLSYYLYLIFYFCPPLILVIYESNKHGLIGPIETALKDPMTYVEVVAEISLANVVVSDIMYVCLG
jgi:hypothetical protein